jgi:hypothetical protein
MKNETKSKFFTKGRSQKSNESFLDMHPLFRDNSKNPVKLFIKKLTKIIVRKTSDGFTNSSLAWRLNE